MVIQPNGVKVIGKVSGFDNDADFIPFDASDDDLAASRPGSRLSPPSLPNVQSLAYKPVKPSSILEDDARKRKRRDIESSPERGPPTQKQKIGKTKNDKVISSPNPWQASTTDYAGNKETSRMFVLDLRD